MTFLELRLARRCLELVTKGCDIDLRCCKPALNSWSAMASSVARLGLGLYVAMEFMRLDSALSTRWNWASMALSMLSKPRRRFREFEGRRRVTWEKVERFERSAPRTFGVAAGSRQKPTEPCPIWTWRDSGSTDHESTCAMCSKGAFSQSRR